MSPIAAASALSAAGDENLPMAKAESAEGSLRVLGLGRPRISSDGDPYESERTPTSTAGLTVQNISSLGPRRVRSLGSASSLQAQEQAEEDAMAIRAFLRSAEGSTLSAWTRHFDRNMDQKITYHEFHRAMRKLNYQGDTQAFFNRLDADGSGELSFEEIDKTQATLWRRFRAWCVASFENGSEMMKRIGAITRQNPECIRIEAFQDAIPKLGWTGGLEDVLFQAIDVENEHCLSQLNLKWLEVEKRRQRRKEEAKIKSLAVGWRAPGFKQRLLHATLADFKDFLKKRFGNFVRSWRKVLAADGATSVHKVGFFKACASLSWNGDVRLLWQAFDKDENCTITMEELDSKSATLLAHFKVFLDKKFGDCATAYRSFDRSKRTKLNFEEFSANLRSIEFNQRIRLLFAFLDKDNMKVITEEDFCFLDKWKPAAFLTAQPNPQAASEFKECLTHQYRTFLKAWRQVLDLSRSNRCNWDQFQSACKKVNFHGDVAGAWRALDEDMGGFITLGEFDAVSCETLMEFRNWCDEEFGGVRSAFGVFDSDGGGTVTYREFRRAARIYGFEGNVHLLFNGLDVEKTGALSIDEVSFLEDWDFVRDDTSEQEKVEHKEIIATAHRGNRLKSTNGSSIEYVTDAPGPGSYNIGAVVGAGPTQPNIKFCGAFSFRSRPQAELLPKLEGPAPGQYDDLIGRALVWNSKPSCVFGSEKRPSNNVLPRGKSAEPGPGSYTHHNTSHARNTIMTPRRPLRVHPLMKFDTQGGKASGFFYTAR